MMVFVAGVALGVFVGVVVMAALAVGRDLDEMDRLNQGEDER